jgi:hypothetical protein
LIKDDDALMNKFKSKIIEQNKWHDWVNPLAWLKPNQIDLTLSNQPWLFHIANKVDSKVYNLMWTWDVNLAFKMRDVKQSIQTWSISNNWGTVNIWKIWL